MTGANKIDNIFAAVGSLQTSVDHLASEIVRNEHSNTMERKVVLAELKTISRSLVTLEYHTKDLERQIHDNAEAITMLKKFQSRFEQLHTRALLWGAGVSGSVTSVILTVTTYWKEFFGVSGQ